VASPCKRFFTTTDLQIGEEIATIFSRAIFFAALTGTGENKEKFINNESHFRVSKLNLLKYKYEMEYEIYNLILI
jgi:hypothetical protein